MIELRALTKQMNGTPVVDSLDLTVMPAERVALVGPSGCGKTTVLRMIAGLLEPDGGTILIGGDVATTPRDLAAHLRGIGYVPQSSALFPAMNVAHNVGYGLGGRERTEREKAVAAALEEFGLSALASRRPSELSGGQARRVALARAMAPRPARLLLDEPLTNLDAVARDELLASIDEAVASSKASLLLVTHDEEEASRLGARVVRMDVVADG